MCNKGSGLESCFFCNIVFIHYFDIYPENTEDTEGRDCYETYVTTLRDNTVNAAKTQQPGLQFLMCL